MIDIDLDDLPEDYEFDLDQEIDFENPSEQNVLIIDDDFSSENLKNLLNSKIIYIRLNDNSFNQDLEFLN